MFVRRFARSWQRQPESRKDLNSRVHLSWRAQAKSLRGYTMTRNRRRSGPTNQSKARWELAMIECPPMEGGVELRKPYSENFPRWLLGGAMRARGYEVC